ncbi:hypothetical protein DAPPUDRAFT_256252 [Daphnia pulex]|uniref:Uncharacterized protein n=1 Tax=Daphnia pulex TaxID=6669 RepID=E9HB82_DAPPU|nr:hypothetical protein DAPPUDRAFT_256252 [Daphnia pulex]|eukprot:EFX71053.1 hypothetical protein DAPPUDRAFT_256252 [Daphnia pulex]
MSTSGHHYHLRSSPRQSPQPVSTNVTHTSRTLAMATVDDALDAAAAPAAAATAATGRLDAVKRNQLTMTTQLAGIAQQLQALLNASEGGGGGGAGGGGAGGGGAGGGGAGGGGAGGGGVVQRRRIDPSCLDDKTSYTATRRLLSFAPGGITGAISASLTS